MKLKFKRLPHAEGLPLPGYKTAGAAGMDICAAEDFKISPHSGAKIGTGFCVELPNGYELQVRSRSSFAAQGIFVTNSPGTIDSDYRGEIQVLFSNLTNRTIFIYKGDRIAQLVLARTPKLDIEEVEELSDTERGDGGFGSTGK